MMRAQTQTSDDDARDDEPRVDEQVQRHEDARDVQWHLTAVSKDSELETRGHSQVKKQVKSRPRVKTARTKESGTCRIVGCLGETRRAGEHRTALLVGRDDHPSPRHRAHLVS